MKGVLQFLFAAIVVPALATGAGAGPTVVINFDTDPSNMPIPNGTQIDNVYSSLGVTFSATLPGGCGDGAYSSSNCLSAPAPLSAPNVVTLCPVSTCSDISENAHGLVRAALSQPADAVCIGFVPVDEGHQGVIRAYDSAHNLLGQSTSSGGGGAETICVSAPGIQVVEFSGLGGSFGWFDDLSIEFKTVPVEPMTFSSIKVRFE